MAPSPEAVLLELTSLLRRICECETLELTSGTRIGNIPGIDSLRLLQAVAHLEEYFRVEIDVVALDNMYRVADVLNAVTAARPANGDDNDEAVKE